MIFFRLTSPLNPARIQLNFNNALKRNGIEISSEALELLFARVHQMSSATGGDSNSPFPLLQTVAAAHSHAKTLKAALGGKTGPKLGKYQQILADFYGYGKWDFFTRAVADFAQSEDLIIY